MCVCVCVVWVRGCVRVPLSVPVNYICARASSGACSGTPEHRHTRHTQSAAARSLSSSLAPEEALGPPRAYGERLWCGRRPARHPCPLCDFQSPGFARRVAGLPRPQRLGGQEEQGGGGVKDLRLARAAHAPSGAGCGRICRPATRAQGSTRFPPLAPNLGIHKLSHARTTSTAPSNAGVANPATV